MTYSKEKHKYLFKCVAKISAYLRGDNQANAKEWAEKLVIFLKQEGLIK